VRAARIDRVSRLFLLVAAALAAAPAAHAQYVLAGRVVSPDGGAELTSGASDCSISADGRYVAFISTSDNIGVPFNGSYNVYRYDLVADELELAMASIGSGNSFAPSISADGAAIAFPSLANLGGSQGASHDVYYSVRNGTGGWDTTLASPSLSGVPDGAAQFASLSPDGRWIAYHSTASNLVPSDTNGQPDIFLSDALDLASGPIRVSVDGSGAQIAGPSRALSRDAVSLDGRRVVFAVDTPVSIDGSNAGTLEDVFVRDLVAGTTKLVSQSTEGVAGSSSSDMPAISPSGRFVVFRSFSTNLVASPTGSRIYLRDLDEDTTYNLPLPDGAASCGNPHVSDTADIVVQCSMNVTASSQAFLYEAEEGAFYQLSTSITAGYGNGESGDSLSISANGLLVAFDTAASNLIENDGNSSDDVFVIVPEPGAALAAFAAVAALSAIGRGRPR
jgi:hypothetical protein